MCAADSESAPAFRRAEVRKREGGSGDKEEDSITLPAECAGVKS